MRISISGAGSGALSLRVGLAVTTCVLVPLLLFAAAPSWWSQRPVFNVGATADDYAPANQGQLKNIAQAAAAEMDAQFPSGAGEAVHAVVDPWSFPTDQTNDFSPVNLGQVKNVAKVFYDRLFVVGLATRYPWQEQTNATDDFAVCNVGQLKNIFSFPIDLLYDGDHNGLPDAWERKYFGESGVDQSGDNDGDGIDNLTEYLSSTDPTNADTDGDGLPDGWELSNGTDPVVNDSAQDLDYDGLSNEQEFLGGTNPRDYYNGNPLLIGIVSGDNQAALPAHFLREPLVVRILDSGGRPIPNSAVTFSVAEGGGFVSSDPFVIGATETTSLTDQDGLAWAYYKSGSASNLTGRVVVSSAAKQRQVSFTARIVSTAPPGRKSVALGWRHVLALYGDGTVWAWGDNSHGQLGDGTRNSRWYRGPVKGLHNIVSVAAHHYTSVALRDDGTVWTWGQNQEYSLGNGTSNDSSVPVQVLVNSTTPLQDVVGIASGYSHNLALKSDGTVWAWGADWAYELGNSSGMDSPFAIPVRLPSGNLLTGVAAVSCGDDHNIALMADGSVWTWGYNSDGELGTGYADWRNAVPTPVPNLSGIVAIAGGAIHSLALDANGRVWAWGYNGQGDVGSAQLNSIQLPASVAGVDHVVAIAAGDYHSMGVKSDGSVWAWGANDSRQLGVGSAPAFSVVPVRVPDLALAIAPIAGQAQSFVTRMDGAVIGWGTNYNGELGNSPQITGISPTVVSDFLLFDDPDHDGAATWKEVTLAGNPNAYSTSGDTISDGWKASYNLNLSDLTLASRDLTNKGLTVLQDYQLGTDPTRISTVNDGIVDGWKVKNGFDPLDPTLASADLTGRGFTLLAYYQQQTVASSFSSVNDGVPDQWKLANGIDPLCTTCAGDDPDNDGLTNLQEYLAGTDPQNTDTDGDRVADGEDGWPNEPSLAVPRVPNRHYIVIDLGIRIPTDLNNFGTVVGALYSGSINSFVWRNGQFNFPSFRGAGRVNDAGQILTSDGVYSSSDGILTPFRIVHNDALGDMSASQITLVDMNAAGIVVAHPRLTFFSEAESLMYGPANALQRYYKNGSTVPPYVVRAIGSEGSFAGGTQIFDHFIWPVSYYLPREAALIRNDAVTSIGILPGFEACEGRVILNRAGSDFVAGFGWNTPLSAAQAFLWHNTNSLAGDRITLDSLVGARRTYPARMNHQLEIVGWSEYTTNAYSVDKYAATIWRNGQVLDLNTLVDNPRWDLQIASSINDSGLIVGNGLFGGEQHGFLLVPAQLMVDGNRDGQMSFDDPAISDADQTTSEHPYRFWLNDDDDTSLTEAEKIPAARPDSSLHQIDSKRNLEDFARLWIQITGLQPAVLSGDILVALKWKTISSGAPAINIYSSADPQGSDNYLKDDDAAQAQISGTFGAAVYDTNGKQTVDANGLFIFRPDYWAGLTGQDTRKCFLFEGVSEGRGELELVFIDRNGVKIGEGGSVWLDLKNIKTMYQRASATPDPLTPLPYKSTNSVFDESAINYVTDVSPRFDQPLDEEPQCLVFVHGWRMGFRDSVSFSETMFKRLWWQGYKGRFAAFRWATQTGATSYNTSEWMAWKYGRSLANYVENYLKHQMPSYTMNIAAHSMGNIVTGSALNRGMTVNTYMLMQAAVPSGCYDDAANTYSLFANADTTSPTPEAAADLGYTLYLGTAATRVGRLVSFFNIEDWALATGTTSLPGGLVGLPFGWPYPTNWEQDQVDFKPNVFNALDSTAGDYRFAPTQPIGHRVTLNWGRALGGGYISTRVVNDIHESLSFVARPRSKAVGSDSYSGSVFAAMINLQTTCNFGRLQTDHSGQFNRRIQELNEFYRRVFSALHQ